MNEIFLIYMAMSHLILVIFLLTLDILIHKNMVHVLSHTILSHRPQYFDAIAITNGIVP
jgi:hypothetical protein